MNRWLDYATQVSELEKMARLSPPPVVSRALPELSSKVPVQRCLVCGKAGARACAACGSVSYCGAAHQRADARWHDVVCRVLREIAEDHRERMDGALEELRQRDVRTLCGWNDILREVPSPARRRRLSEIASRPFTLASMLGSLGIRPRARVHVMAASPRELEVPWELAGADVELALVGPELPFRANTKLTTRRAPYTRALWRELGEPELIIGFNCGLVMYPSWRPTLLDLRGAGVPIVITTFRDWEAAAESRLLTALGAECLLPVAPNPWASLAAKRSSTIANDVSYDNAFVSAWR